MPTSRDTLEFTRLGVGITKQILDQLENGQIVTDQQGQAVTDDDGNPLREPCNAAFIGQAINWFKQLKDMMPAAAVTAAGDEVSKLIAMNEADLPDLDTDEHDAATDPRRS